MSAINLTINGRKVDAPTGETVWNAARKAGVTIPSLCASPNLKPYGSCRLCLCEVDGQRGYPAEEDLKDWAHHHCPYTVPDPLFRKSMDASFVVPKAVAGG